MAFSHNQLCQVPTANNFSVTSQMLWLLDHNGLWLSRAANRLTVISQMLWRALTTITLGGQDHGSGHVFWPPQYAHQEHQNLLKNKVTMIF